jgi:hypothetical protein
MAKSSKSTKTGNGAEPLHSCNPSRFLHGHVGSTATWKCGTPEYPNFHLNFAGTNPYSGTKTATFKGTEKKPVKIALNHPGHFVYTINHIKPDGTQVEGGPYCLSVAPPPTFLIPPRDCPPRC